MKQIEQTILEMINHLIGQHPQLAPNLERMATQAQGKGYGGETVKQEIKTVLQLLNREPALAIDIGGNVGEYAAELRSRKPNLEIHIFEPSKTNIARLENRFQGDADMHIAPFAVSDVSGQATLFSNEPGSVLGSLAKRRLDHFNIAFDATERIEAMRFEEYWSGWLNKRDLDIVKIDIEGHELSALAGFGNAIHAAKIIQFEFGGCNIDTRTYFQDFWYFFKSHDFSIFKITPFGAEFIPQYREVDEFFSTTNYIAVNKNTA